MVILKFMSEVSGEAMFLCLNRLVKSLITSLSSNQSLCSLLPVFNQFGVVQTFDPTGALGLWRISHLRLSWLDTRTVG